MVLSNFPRFSRVILKIALLPACCLLLTTQAHASKRWTYCSVNSPSEVWVTKVFEHDWTTDPASDDVKAQFARMVREQYPGVKPAFMGSLTCVGFSGEFAGFDHFMMIRARDRELKEYSAIHEVRMTS